MGEMRLTPIILTGGEGKRLAPYSTSLCPKPFIPFHDGSSLLQHTLQRVADGLFAPPVFVGNVQHRFLMMNHARLVERIPQAVLLEARSQNTGFAIALLAAFMLQHADAGELVAILPADHAIDNAQAWRDSIGEAAQIAADGESIVLLGIAPTDDSSAYGYIGRDAQGYVTGFREKPTEAAPLCKAGWLWNSGQLIARADTLAAACARYAPALWRHAQEALMRAEQEGPFVTLPDTILEPEQALPFDKAVLEKAANLRVVACDAGWQDVGTPKAFCAYAGIERDEQAIRGRNDHPWGYTEQVARCDRTLQKRLTIYPGCRISLQRHFERDEHWHITEGYAHITLGDDELQCIAGDTVLVPRGIWHRIGNAGGSLLRVDEVQSGLPCEHDIERREDDYGRT